MSDEPSFDFLPWEELPVGVRRNRKKMYNYLVSVLGGDTPTPTGSGTVTATVLYGETPQIGALVYLCTTDTIPSEDDSMVVAMGVTDDTGVTTLGIYDSSTHRPTSETAIPYDDYYLIAMDSDAALTPYDEPFTVDGDEEVTITLTQQE